MPHFLKRRTSMKLNHLQDPQFNLRSQCLILQWPGCYKSPCKSFKHNLTLVCFQPSGNQWFSLIVFLHDCLCRVKRKPVFGKKHQILLAGQGQLQGEEITQGCSFMRKIHTSYKQKWQTEVYFIISMIWKVPLTLVQPIQGAT